MRYFEITGSTLLIALICIVSCSSRTTKVFTPTPDKLIGKWEGIDHTGKQGAFHFFEDGNIILIIDGRPLGGAESSGLGRLTYSADFAQDPVELDIIGIDSSGSEHGKILMIVKFLTRNKIKIRTYFSETRPHDFDVESTDDTIILNRLPD